MIQERENTQQIELQIGLEATQHRQELAAARENIQAEYTNRMNELSQTVDALKKKEVTTEQNRLALGSENQKLASDNELLRASLEESEKKA